jgi:nucleoid-associated protein YgaU
MAAATPSGQAAFEPAARPAVGRRPAVRPPRFERWVLALALAFPLAVAVFGLPRLAGMGEAARAASARPLSGAPPIAGRQTTTAVTPAPTLEAANRARDIAGGPGGTPVAGPASAGATPAVRTYVVQRGDELRHIAEEHGLSVSALLSVNEVPDPDSLRIGQVLKLP